MKWGTTHLVPVELEREEEPLLILMLLLLLPPMLLLMGTRTNIAPIIDRAALNLPSSPSAPYLPPQPSQPFPLLHTTHSIYQQDTNVKQENDFVV